MTSETSSAERAYVVASSAHATTSAAELGVQWLRRVRWVAVVGQVLALVFAEVVLHEHLPWMGVLACIVVVALHNAALHFVSVSSPPKWLVPSTLVLDVVMLTGVLAQTGAATNPFTVVYLVHVALASVMLDAHLAGSLVVLTVVAFGGLFFVENHGSHGHSGHGMHGMSPWSPHYLGMWAAYAISAGTVAYFVGKVSRAIRARERDVARVAQQNERLASLSSFSANAAHELGSPLGSVLVAASEMHRVLAQDPDPDDRCEAMRKDTELIVDETQRCRDILAELSTRAGESMGEMPEARSLDDMAAAWVAGLAPQRRASVDVQLLASGDHRFTAVHKTLQQMVLNLVRNALDAQDEAGVDAPVQLVLDVDDDHIVITVIDAGAGMPPQQLARLGRPFVHDGVDGAFGLGLGVYLVATFAERLGGRLAYRPHVGGGTEAELRLPPL